MQIVEVYKEIQAQEMNIVSLFIYHKFIYIQFILDIKSFYYGRSHYAVDYFTCHK